MEHRHSCDAYDAGGPCDCGAADNPTYVKIRAAIWDAIRCNVWVDVHGDLDGIDEACDEAMLAIEPLVKFHAEGLRAERDEAIRLLRMVHSHVHHAGGFVCEACAFLAKHPEGT